MGIPKNATKTEAEDIVLTAEQRETVKLWAYKILAHDLEHQMRGAPKVYLTPPEVAPGQLMAAMTASGKPMGENTGLDCAMLGEAYKLASEHFAGLINGARLVAADAAQAAPVSPPTKKRRAA